MADSNGVVKLTATERKVMDLLSDGMPHPMRALQALMWEDPGTAEAVSVCITRIRKKINSKGEDIMCRDGMWRLVRYITTK